MFQYAWIYHLHHLLGAVGSYLVAIGHSLPGNIACQPPPLSAFFTTCWLERLVAFYQGNWAPFHGQPAGPVHQCFLPGSGPGMGGGFTIKSKRCFHTLANCNKHFCVFPHIKACQCAGQCQLSNPLMIAYIFSDESHRLI